jgi:hypothetical protein
MNRFRRASHLVSRRKVLGWTGATAGVMSCPGLQAHPGTSEKFRFAFIGDTPYNSAEAQVLTQVFEQIDPACAFVLHIGDIKARKEPWQTAFFEQRLRLFDQVRQPLVLLPGDNEWSDAPRGSAKPAFGWLQWLREHAYQHWPKAAFIQAQSLFERQSIKPDSAAPIENIRWVMAKLPQVMFVSLNIPGGVDPRNFSPRELEAFQALQQFNDVWLTESLAQCSRAGIKHVVIATHADIGFERDQRGTEGLLRLPQDNYSGIRRWLAKQARSFDGQLLFLHGDTHVYRLDQPLLDEQGERVVNFTRVECYGSPFANAWLEVHWQGHGWEVRSRSLAPESRTAT